MHTRQPNKLGGEQPVTRRIMFNAILVVTLGLGSYILRELYPEQPLINWLFGGMRILFFWAFSAYIIYKIDILIFKKEDEKSPSDDN